MEESLRNRREEGNEGEEKEVLEGAEPVSEIEKGLEEVGARDKCAGVTCYNGDCVAEEEEGGKKGGGGRCQCWHGWRGDQCELCGGRVSQHFKPSQKPNSRDYRYSSHLEGEDD